MSKIAIALITRNRPKQVDRFLTSVYETATDHNNICAYLYIDNDDILTVPAIENFQQKYPLKIKYLIGERIMMSDMVNKLIPLITEDIFFLVGDDLIMRTKGWDEMIIKKFDEIPDKIALLYGNDLIQTTLATHPIIHRKWVELLGYLTPPYFSCDYADTWLNELADNIGRKYKLPFVNEHMHPCVNKGEVDQTFIEKNQRHSRDNNANIFNTTKHLRIADTEKLKAYIQQNAK